LKYSIFVPISLVFHIVLLILLVYHEFSARGISGEEWFDVLENATVSGSNHEPKLVPSSTQVLGRDVLGKEPIVIALVDQKLLVNIRVVRSMDLDVGATVS
jgi:hypothetical protein